MTKWYCRHKQALKKALQDRSTGDWTTRFITWKARRCVHHIDSLLKIDALDGIEWTPQAGIEGGGHARWYPIYKKILDSGKRVQASACRRIRSSLCRMPVAKSACSSWLGHPTSPKPLG